jgi:hypothetical protein
MFNTTDGPITAPNLTALRRSCMDLTALFLIAASPVPFKHQNRTLSPERRLAFSSSSHGASTVTSSHQHHFTHYVFQRVSSFALLLCFILTWAVNVSTFTVVLASSADTDFFSFQASPAARKVQIIDGVQDLNVLVRFTLLSSSYW